MRGADTFIESLFTLRKLEDFVPAEHPLRPIRQMVSLVDDIADGEGDLTKRLTTRSVDELGDLAKGINRFIDKLQVLLGDVLKTASEVNRHAGDTDRIAGQTDTNLQHHQAEMEQMLTAVQEMSYVSQEVATHANNTADSAKQAQGAADQGKVRFQQVIQSMHKVAAEAGKGAEVVEGLAHDSEQICSTITSKSGLATGENGANAILRCRSKKPASTAPGPAPSLALSRSLVWLS